VVPRIRVIRQADYPPSLVRLSRPPRFLMLSACTGCFEGFTA
jgi:hypothetical protein